MMERFFIVMLLASVFLFGDKTASAQTDFSKKALGTLAKKHGPKIFTPLKNVRERASNGVLSDAKAKVCENCKLNGKLCKKCAEKRKERAGDKADDKEKLEKFEEAELKKIEAEAKKTELEAKLLEEQDIERNKPWDIADEENLESPSELLQLAAASKQDQDLAPRKQAALEYLAKLGCNKDPNVEKAIIAGLKDHNAEVRLAAIQAVLIAVRGPMPAIVSEGYDPYSVNFGDTPGMAAAPGMGGSPNPGPVATGAPAPAAGACNACQGKRHRKKILKGLCRSCRGNGCNSCNYCGETTEVYTEPCSMCFPQMQEVPCEACTTCTVEDGCRSCCPSKEIMAELKRIAFEPDPERDNCRYEPSLDVRNLALEALNVCPPLKVEKPDTGKTPITETEEGEDKPKGISEEGTGIEGGSKESVIDVVPAPVPGEPAEGVIPLKGEDKVEPLGGDTTTQYGNDTRFQSVAYSGSGVNSQFLTARLAKFMHDNTYLVELEGDYLIPNGKRLFIQNSAGASQIVEVIGSEIGFVKVSPIEGTLFDQQDARLSVGIVQ